MATLRREQKRERAKHLFIFKDNVDACRQVFVDFEIYPVIVLYVTATDPLERNGERENLYCLV